MTLVPPQSWNDVERFLMDGGYRSLFHQRAQHTEQDPSQDGRFLKLVTETIGSNPEHFKWLQAWVEIASIPDALHHAIPSVFFDTAWHIYRQGVPEARKVLQRYRKGNALHGLPGSGESRGEPSLFAHGAAGTAEVWGCSDVPSGLLNQWGERSHSPLSSISDEDSTPLTERNLPLNESHGEFTPGSPSGLLPSKKSALSDPPDEGDNQVPEEVDCRSKNSRYKLRSQSRVEHEVPNAIWSEKNSFVEEDSISDHSGTITTRRTRTSSRSMPHLGKPPSGSTEKPRVLRKKNTGKGRLSTPRKSPPQISSRGDTKTTALRSQQQGSPPDISNFTSQRALRAAARNNKRFPTGQSESVIISSHSKKTIFHAKAKKTFRDNKIVLRKKATPWKRKQAQWTKKKKTVMSRMRNLRGIKRVIRWTVKSVQPQKKITARRSKITLTNSAAGESTMDISSDAVRTANGKSISSALLTDNGADIDLNHATVCSPRKRSHTVLVEENIALDNDTHEPEEPPPKRPRIYRTPPMGYDDTSQGCDEPKAESSPPASFSPRVPDIKDCQPDISLDLDISSSTASLSVAHMNPYSPRHVSVDRIDSTSRPSSPRPRIYRTPSMGYDDTSQGCDEPKADSSPPASFSPRVSGIQGYQPDVSLDVDMSSSTASLSVAHINPNSPRHVSVDRIDLTSRPSSPRPRIYRTPSMGYDDTSQGCDKPEADSSPPASFSPRVSGIQGYQPEVSMDLDISSYTASLSVAHINPYPPRHVSVDIIDSTSRPSSPSPDGRMVSLLPTTPTTGDRSEACNDTPISSQSTLVENSPSTEGSSLKHGPPWVQSIDPPSPSSSARGPRESDTHSWHVSPELLSLCFPVQTSHAEVENQVKKPQLPMTPPVWAQSRQELCESLPYFRSYQGGVYTRGKKALGYLLDGHPAAQDLWHTEGKLIISHAGGNSAVDKDTKQTVLVNDQTGSSVSCAALINSYKCNQPIVLIAGNGYNLFPYDLEHRSYVVLGYYLITKTWEEPEPSSTSLRGYFVRRKFLFQWIDSQGQPWWIQNSLNKTLFSLSPDDLETDDVKLCSECHRESPQIYNFGWVCTYATCHTFFRQRDGNRGQEGYSPRFLIPRAESTRYEANRLQIRPGPPVKLEQISDRETTSRRFWNGFCCSNCGRLSCREHWTHWECCNCQEKLLVKHRLRTAGDGTLPTGRIKFQIGENSGIESKTEKFRHNAGVFRGRSFKLPWNRGIIYVIEANPIANVSANKIFLQYQRDAEDPAFFRRYCMKSHKLKGRMLSHYFSQNSGEPYKYVGGTDNTVPLDEYVSVRQAIDLIRERTAMAMGSDPLFNEILSAAYMVDQKMEFHSDGEKDLGPVVASLSLGAPATMRFRAIPTRVKHNPSEMTETNVRKSPPIVLTLTLRHGDILVMAGAEIQEFYQHAVHPTGFRIAATARYIKAENPCVPKQPGYASSSIS